MLRGSQHSKYKPKLFHHILEGSSEGRRGQRAQAPRGVRPPRPCAAITFIYIYLPSLHSPRAALSAFFVAP